MTMYEAPWSVRLMPSVNSPVVQAQVLQKSLEDLLKMERLWRQRAEKEAADFRRLLERLAYQMGGGQLVEDARRANPQAFNHWTAEDWEQIFHAIVTRERGWEADKPAPTPQLKTVAVNAPSEKTPVHQLAAQPKTEDAPPRPSKRKKRKAKKSKAPVSSARPIGLEQIIAGLKEIDWANVAAPDMYQDLERAGGVRWRRGVMILYLLARFGVNSRMELAFALSGAFGKSLATARTWVRRAGDFLVERNLVVAETLRVQNPATSLSVYKLSQDGRHFAQRMGWPVVESEWERVERLHEGNRFPAHTLGILAFALHARLRGWRVLVLPPKQNATPPDVLIQRDGQRWYVEVELSQKENAAKWRHNAEDNGGKVALVAATPDRRHVLVADCKRLGLPGVATDLQTLIETRLSEINADTPLWTEVWQ